MKKYARYKDSGISWIGDVPEHWETKRVGAYFNENKALNKDFIFKKAYQFKFGSLVLKNELGDEREYEDTYVKYTVLNENDIVFNGLNLNYDFVSQRVAICPAPSIITSAYIAMSPKNSIDSMYYLWLFKTMDNKKMLHGMGSGIRLTLSFADIKNQLIPIPPLSEQKAIAEYLDKKTAQINELVSAKQKQIELLKEYKQSVIANAVTGKIDEINDTRHFSTLVELSSMRRMGSRPTDKRREKINWIGYLPRHWQKRKFQYLFKERSEKNHPEEPVLCATQSRGVIPQSMYENRVVVVNTGFEGLKFVKKGDFVISLRSFQGGIEYAHYQGIISAAYTILYINTKDLYSDYVRLLFKSVPFIGLLQTCVTGIREGQNINNDLLRKQIIPVPPLSEQKEIVAYIEKKVSSIDSQIASIENQIANLNEYKQSLISDVVTGKVKVC